MLAWITESAPYGVITTDTQFRVQSWNQWMETHSAREPGEVLQQDLFVLFPDLLKRNLKGSFERALLGETSVLSTALHKYLLPLPLPENEMFPFMQQTARVEPLVFDKQIQGTIIVVEDVTQRETQALIMRRQHERDEILSWALAQLLKSGEPKKIIRDLFYKVAEFLDFDAYMLYLFEGSPEMELEAVGGIPPELQERFSRIEPRNALWPPFSELVQARVYEEIDNPASQLAILYREMGMRSCALLPLLIGERSLGTLCFGTRTRPQVRESELDLLSTIAQYVAIALQRENTAVELREAQFKLNQHAQELEKKVTERTETLRNIIAELETFSYTLAHDLRGPIRALTGYCEVLLEDYSRMLPEEGNRIITKLANACQKLDTLTKDLLEFSKVSRQEIKVTPVAIESVIADVVAMAAPVRAECITVANPMHSVIANRILLQQCLSNLVDNALKFVQHGTKPSIIISAEIVSREQSQFLQQSPFTSARYASGVDVGKAGASPGFGTPFVRIMIKDNGIGVAPEAQSKIFGIFERATISPEYEGTGIGLAIVARAVERMNGRCGVHSKPDSGSCFWIELPKSEE
jgi:signal transduction histidine kinase